MFARIKDKHWALLATGAVLLSAGGCRHHDQGPQVAGWSMIDATQRHPIVVVQEPVTLTLSVRGGAAGLTPAQRSELVQFARKMRAADAGDSKLRIEAPSGGANELAAMDAVHDIKRFLEQAGFEPSVIAIEAYAAAQGASPPIRVSYIRHVAEAPECASWPTNLAHERDNQPFENFGCARQRNLAASVANPADLLGPRTETARSSERRDAMWGKYVKGESTHAKRSQDERAMHGFGR